MSSSPNTGEPPRGLVNSSAAPAARGVAAGAAAPRCVATPDATAASRMTRRGDGRRCGIGRGLRFELARPRELAAGGEAGAQARPLADDAHLHLLPRQADLGARGFVV